MTVIFPEILQSPEVPPIELGGQCLFWQKRT
jgi:hypothetical protein